MKNCPLRPPAALTSFPMRPSLGSRMLAALILVLPVAPLHAAQFGAGVGIFTLAENGADIQINYHPEQGSWLFGYKFTRWTDTFHDPFTGRELTKTTNTMTGPIANYLFSPESPGTWYLGIEVLRWTRKEKWLFTGATSSDSTFAPFFGGGYMASPGESFYYNLGFFLSPFPKLSTNTGYSSEESSGGFDIQLQLGIAF